ncbi:hypothetical protein PISMIDRAFT_574582 [Pisolithus microcarpus 441]|uniref:Uncharacterized protein n=1 Tax=Pisolithus microcarpus 441 TaxID=765257 RepID=A0A0C9Y827_9AGAM|nr:hypothetical protein PISMIDRAFT_574582 [Pisolithus microcarpus 441]
MVGASLLATPRRSRGLGPRSMHCCTLAIRIFFLRCSLGKFPKILRTLFSSLTSVARRKILVHVVRSTGRFRTWNAQY